MASAKTEDLKGLKWPIPAANLAGQGVALPLDKLLQSLQLVATDDDRVASTRKRWKDGTPDSMQVIKAGALGLTKGGIAWVGSVGGVTGVAGAITGVITSFVGGVGQNVTIALIGGAALLLSAVAIALALFVKGDLEARGIATAARHQGRAEVAAAFLTSTAAMPATTVPHVQSDYRALLEAILHALQSPAPADPGQDELH